MRYPIQLESAIAGKVFLLILAIIPKINVDQNSAYSLAVEELKQNWWYRTIQDLFQGEPPTSKPARSVFA